MEAATPCTSGVTIRGARLQAKKANVLLSGTVAAPSTWAGGTPGANGVRVVLADLDVTGPGGDAWKANRNGNRSRYVEPAGAQGGIGRIDLGCDLLEPPLN